jgi:hypothetical protein
MALIFKTIVVAAADVEAARLACATIEGGQGMFSVALTTDPAGAGPATHWGSSGDMPEEILPLMWPSAADISDDQPQAMMTRLGLRMVAEEV